MEFVCGGDKPYLNTASLEGEHQRMKDKAIEYFTTQRPATLLQSKLENLWPKVNDTATMQLKNLQAKCKWHCNKIKGQLDFVTVSKVVIWEEC